MKNTCPPGFGSSGPAGTMCALVMSTSARPAPPEPPPPVKWWHPVSCASPVIVPLAKRSNSTHPQKPPRSFGPQKDGLLQLPEIPTCHVSWPARRRRHRRARQTPPPAPPQRERGHHQDRTPQSARQL